MTGVNLGSGQRPFHSTGDWKWINVDIQPKWEPDIVADAANLPMIESESVDMVVLHHCLEHAGCGEAGGEVREAHRILRVGGSLLTCVPDMLELAIAYIEGRLHPEPAKNTQLYMTNVYGAFMGDEADRHKWGYDNRSLVAFLMACAPWMKTRLFDGRKIPGADIALAWHILAIEVLK